MKAQRTLLSAILFAIAIVPTRAGTAQTPGSVPDLAGSWNHADLNGLELPLSGPGPVTNRSRLRTGPQTGAGNNAQLVGDYTNPILQPWAAEVLKKFGEISLSGKGYPTPRNQCWPEQVPFVFANYGMQLLQGDGKITILYPYDHQYRQIRMNVSHPAELTPSWYGDSVGHYDGDTLVVDTVGVKVGPFSMIDWYGTPFTSALHVVERYRQVDIEATMEAIRRDAKEHIHFANPDNGPIVDAAYKGDGLQIELTVEDENAFTTPWTALVTFRRALDERLELVCAENPQWHPGTYASVPIAENPDF